MIKVVVIDGLIGSGKSTGLNVLSEWIPRLSDYAVVLVLEPVELWKETGRLALFYSDMKRRSYQFQTKVFHDRNRYYQAGWAKAKKLEADGQNVLLLMERAIFSDRIFADVLYEDGLMDKSEMEDYIDLWGMWIEIIPKTPDVFIYFCPSLETVMERQRNRGRAEESGVSVEYQQRLMDHHDKYYQSGEQTLDGKVCPMHRLNTDFDYRDSEDGAKKLSEMFLAIM